MDETFHAGSILKPWQTILASLSKANIAAATQGLNDMAFAYRTEAPLVIGEHRKIRAPAFIKSRFLVEKAKPGRLDHMQAIAGSIKSERFSGFAEDYGEASPGRGTRSIGANARGGDMAAKAKQQNRLMGDIPSVDQFAIPGAPNQRIAAMISMIARHPSIAPQGTFILHGGGMTAGVYRLKAGATKGKRNKAGVVRGAVKQANADTYAPAIQRVQTFKIKIDDKKIDWAHITLKRVEAKAQSIMLKAFAKSFGK
jgi:hypothetical protein